MKIGCVQLACASPVQPFPISSIRTNVIDHLLMYISLWCTCLCSMREKGFANICYIDKANRNSLIISMQIPTKIFFQTFYTANIRLGNGFFMFVFFYRSQSTISLQIVFFLFSFETLLYAFLFVSLCIHCVDFEHKWLLASLHAFTTDKLANKNHIARDKEILF